MTRSTLRLRAAGLVLALFGSVLALQSSHASAADPGSLAGDDGDIVIEVSPADEDTIVFAEDIEVMALDGVALHFAEDGQIVALHAGQSLQTPRRLLVGRGTTLSLNGATFAPARRAYWVRIARAGSS